MNSFFFLFFFFYTLHNLQKKSEKKEAFTVANAHLIENKRPAWTPVSMVLDEGETPDFKSFFFQWEPPMKPRDWSTPVSSGVAKSVEQKEIDVDALVTSTRARAGSTMADDGSGKVEVWRIENFDKVKVDDAQVGNFFSGDSYIVLYTYMPNGKSREEYIIYFWQGKKSTPDEKGTSALLATKMDDDMGGRPVQVRVVQGKEPSHFCALFKGKLITHDGGKASGFSTSKQKDEADDDGISLFHIRGALKKKKFISSIISSLSPISFTIIYCLLLVYYCFCCMYWYFTDSIEKCNTFIIFYYF